MIELALAATGQAGASPPTAPVAGTWLTHPIVVQLMATASAILVAVVVIWLNRWLQRRDERTRVRLLLVHTLDVLRFKAKLTREAANSVVDEDRPQFWVYAVAQHPERQCTELSALWPKTLILDTDAVDAVEAAKVMADAWREQVAKFGVAPESPEQIDSISTLLTEVIEACDTALKALGHREQDDEAAGDKN